MSKNNRKNQRAIIKRSSAWVKSLFLLFFILLPAILIWFFTSPDFGTNIFNFSFWTFFGISIAFIFYSFIITLIFFFFRLLDLQIFYFLVPITLSLAGIYLSYSLPLWARFLVTVTLVLSAIPTNIIVNAIEDRMIWRAKVKRNLKKD